MIIKQLQNINKEIYKCVKNMHEHVSERIYDLSPLRKWNDTANVVNKVRK